MIAHTVQGNATVKILRLENALDLSIPAYATAGSAGVDLLSAVEEEVQIKCGDRSLISTGIKLIIPEGLEGQIRSRSGLAYKNGIFVLNSPGTIDSDYRGEIMVLLSNFGQHEFIVKRGMKIAQMVFAPFLRVDFDIVGAKQFEHNTQRGTGGFGSTGL